MVRNHRVVARGRYHDRMTWSGADDFAAISESAPLVEELRGRIGRDGPIRFREFMEAALYHPQYGYYPAAAQGGHGRNFVPAAAQGGHGRTFGVTSAAVTSRGEDFVTSPEVHPVFGAPVCCNTSARSTRKS